MTLYELAHICERDISLNWIHGLDSTSGTPWHAHIENSETKDGAFLRGSYGRGSTPEGALRDYVNEIRGKTLVFNAMRNNRKEIGVPTTLSFD